MSPTITRILRIAAGILVIAAFLLALLSQAGELQSYSWNVAPLYLLVAVGVALSRGPFIVYPWWRIIQSWGYPLLWWQAVRVYFHSGLARYLPGQYWYILGRAYLAERKGIPKTITTASTLVETLLVTGSAAGVASLGLATAPGWSAPIVALFVALAIFLPLLVVALSGLPLSARFWNWLMQRVKRGPLPSQLSWGNTMRALFACYVNWILYGLIAVLALTGVAGGAYLSQAVATIGIFATSVLGAAIVPFVPQGIVIREGILVFLLHMLLGVPVPVAVAAAALTRLIAMGAEGLWALAALRSQEKS